MPRSSRFSVAGCWERNSYSSPRPSVVVNIHGLIGEIQQRFGSMQDVPYLDVVKAISAYEARRRR